MTTATIERRRSTRKRIKSGIVAVLHPDGPLEIGNIIDINDTGLSFIMNTDEQPNALGNSVKMDILLINENVFLEHVATSVVSKKLWQNNQPITTSPAVYCYGVKFDKLALLMRDNSENLSQEHMPKLRGRNL